MNQATLNFTETINHTCPSCGGKLEGRWESLTRGLCFTLLKFYTATTSTGSNHLHVRTIEALNKTEFANFQKLRYFGLVQKSEQSGYWSITYSGFEFLRGRKDKPKKVYVFRNRVKEVDEQRVYLKDILSDSDIAFWLSRADYVSGRG